MERMAWSDERLDDRFDQIDRRFDRIDSELLELRREMHAGFAGMRAEMEAMRTTVYRFGSGFLIAQFGMIAAILGLIARG